MKPRALLRLIVSLCVIVGFVVGATILESNGSLNTTAWYWAQRKLPLLWVVDSFAVLTLLPVLGFATLQNRLTRKAEEIAHSRDEYQHQLKIMIHNVEQTERLNAEQADRIEELQETVAHLSETVTAMQTDATARHHALEAEVRARYEALEAEATARHYALEAEAQHLAEQAFAALVGQMEVNTRQMEAVNLAMQYQRAEIKQLRQGMRAIQRPREIIDVAHLTPAELAALHGEDTALLLEAEKQQAEADETAEEQGDLETHPPGFFEPTMNAETTFIAPMTEYEISPFEDAAAGPATNAAENSEAPSERTETHAAVYSVVNANVPQEFSPYVDSSLDLNVASGRDTGVASEALPNVVIDAPHEVPDDEAADMAAITSQPVALNVDADLHPNVVSDAPSDFAVALHSEATLPESLLTAEEPILVGEEPTHLTSEVPTPGVGVTAEEAQWLRDQTADSPSASSAPNHASHLTGDPADDPTVAGTPGPPALLPDEEEPDPPHKSGLRRWFSRF